MGAPSQLHKRNPTHAHTRTLAQPQTNPPELNPKSSVILVVNHWWLAVDWWAFAFVQWAVDWRARANSAGMCLESVCCEHLVAALDDDADDGASPHAMLEKTTQSRPHTRLFCGRCAAMIVVVGFMTGLAPPRQRKRAQGHALAQSRFYFASVAGGVRCAITADHFCQRACKNRRRRCRNHCQRRCPCCCLRSCRRW